MHTEDQGGLTHIDASGRARMVDVSRKPWTRRRAVARCSVVLGGPPGDPLGDARSDARASGDAEVADPARRPLSEVLDEARLAGIQAAKLTPQLIPLCHVLTSATVSVAISVTAGAIEVESQAEVVGPTGVEMEALTACAYAGLALIAALRRFHPEATLEDLTLWEKSGGRSGSWIRTGASERPDHP
jgi:cyclic pyranopterin phosphate synthase